MVAKALLSNLFVAGAPLLTLRRPYCRRQQQPLLALLQGLSKATHPTPLSINPRGDGEKLHPILPRRSGHPFATTLISSDPLSLPLFITVTRLLVPTARPIGPPTWKSGRWAILLATLITPRTTLPTSPFHLDLLGRSSLNHRTVALL